MASRLRAAWTLPVSMIMGLAVIGANDKPFDLSLKVTHLLKIAELAPSLYHNWGTCIICPMLPMHWGRVYFWLHNTRLSFSFPSLPFHSPPLPSHSFHIKVGPLNPARRLGSAVSCPSWVWILTILVHLPSKSDIWWQHI